MPSDAFIGNDDMDAPDTIRFCPGATLDALCQSLLILAATLIEIGFVEPLVKHRLI